MDCTEVFSTQAANGRRLETILPSEPAEVLVQLAVLEFEVLERFGNGVKFRAPTTWLVLCLLIIDANYRGCKPRQSHCANYLASCLAKVVAEFGPTHM